MECELCGRESRRLFKVRIEGVVLEVCKSCAKLGTPVYDQKRRQRRKRDTTPIPETELDPEFSKKIVAARETLKLTREDVARKARMSPSYLEKLETGKLKPTIEDAKKLERVLGVSVITVVKQEKPKREKREPRPRQEKPRKMKEPVTTLGDIANIIVKKA